jgi:large subunit ribosomal protein L25
MADMVPMTVEPRTGVGKGAARAARRAGYVPGVIYGAGQDPTTIQILGSELLKTLQQGGFYTTMFELDVAGEKHRVIPKDMQKNLLNGLPTHVDFLRLKRGATVTIEVPVEFENEKESPGLEQGGVLNVVRHAVEVEVLATAMPDTFMIDLTGYEIGDSINASAITLPEGASFTITDRDFTVATVAAPAGMGGASEDESEETTETTEMGPDITVDQDGSDPKPD